MIGEKQFLGVVVYVVFIVIVGFYGLFSDLFGGPERANIYLALTFAALIFAGGIIQKYNRLVRETNRAKEGLSEIDIQLNRRFDLAESLVGAVKSYARQEEKVFEDVTNIRAGTVEAKSANDREILDKVSKEAIKNVLFVAEAYPNLKSSENFKKLQDQLSALEGYIAASRMFYNSRVTELNNSIETFPTNIVAKVFRFKKFEYFEKNKSQEMSKISLGASL